MLVESFITDVRTRATRSEQMLKTLRFTAFMQRIGSRIENTFLSLAWLSSCLVQTTWSSKDNNPLKIEFGSKFIWP